MTIVKAMKAYLPQLGLEVNKTRMDSRIQS